MFWLALSDSASNSGWPITSRADWPVANEVGFAVCEKPVIAVKKIRAKVVTHFMIVIRGRGFTWLIPNNYSKSVRRLWHSGRFQFWSGPGGHTGAKSAHRDTLMYAIVTGGQDDGVGNR